ncbi:MAG: hypothetical protein ACIAS6_00090 [Phycisphaerales bacterium JB060]
MNGVESLADVDACLRAVDAYLARLPLDEDVFDPEATLSRVIKEYVVLAAVMDALMEVADDTTRSDVQETLAELPW